MYRILLAVAASLFVFASSLVVTADAPTDSLAPFIADPEGPYVTTAAYDASSNAYVFTYTGVHTTTYTLDLDDVELQTGRLRIGAITEEGPMAYPIAGAGPRYRRRDETILEPDEVATTAVIRLSDHGLTDDILHLSYTITLDGVNHHLRYDVWLQGGALTWHVTDIDGRTSGLRNFWGFRIGSSESTPNARSVLLPYLPDPVATYGSGYYFSAYLDRSKSNSYRFERILDEPSGVRVSAYNMGLPELDSAGHIEPLDETGYLAVSPVIADVLPRPNHPPSPYRGDLSHRLTLDVWHVPVSWHDPWPRDAVRAWTSPITATAHIRGLAYDSDPDCGQGVVVSIRHNDLELWAAVIENGNTTGFSPSLDVDVTAGDVLYFHISNRGGNNWCDSTAWEPIITTPADVYRASRDWSSTQGQRNWRYLEYRGADGYAEMIWDTDHWQGSSTYSRLYQDGGHPGQSTELDTFRRYHGLLDDLARYGITDLNVIIHVWQRYGYDVKLPDHYPANPNWGGSEAMRSLISHAVTADNQIALHENYVDHYPDAPRFDWENVAWNADGSPKLCWYNQSTGIQSYCTANDKTLPLADTQGSLIAADYAPSAGYEDVDTGWRPTQWIDLDAENPIPHTYAEAVRLRKRFFQHQRAQYEGPLFGEGGEGPDRYDTYYAGYVDGVEAQIEGRAGAPFIPDFELRAVQPLQVNQGLGYIQRYFFPSFLPPNQVFEMLSGQSYPLDRADQDRYRAQQIAYGHSGWLDFKGEFPWLRPSLGDTMTEYYLMRALQTRYLDSTIEDIAYEANGVWADLSGALQTDVDFYNPHLRLTYADGTRIFVNGEQRRGWYATSEDFSYRQGEHGWRYRYWDGKMYRDLTWDPSRRTWQGPRTYCLINRWSMHPDGCEPALVWTSPVTATVRVRAWIEDGDAGGGDGITASIWHNRTRVWSQTIENGDPTVYTPDFNVSVSAGDVLVFRVNQNDNSDWDSTRFDVWLTYDDPADHAWVVHLGAPGAPSVALPANGWVAWNTEDGFLAYTAQQDDGGIVDYSQSGAYTFARSRDGTWRTIGAITTDGTVALVTPVTSNWRNVYATEVSHINAEGRPVLTSNEPITVSLAYSDTDSLVATVDPYPAAKQYTVTYADLPASWRASDGALYGRITVRNLTDNGIPGSPITWSSPDNRSIRMTLHSGQQVLVQHMLPPNFLRYLPLISHQTH